MTIEEWEDYKKLSGKITEKLDNTSTYESWLIIQEYIDRQQQENKKLRATTKKQKEVIDKLELENKVLKEQMVAMVKPNYTYGIR